MTQVTSSVAFVMPLNDPISTEGLTQFIDLLDLEKNVDKLNQFIYKIFVLKSDEILF